MEFTGERVVPGKVETDLWNEHVSRYYFARSIVSGCVLDLGCGTGYGSVILSESAREVVALDICQESVAFGLKNYSRPNMGFLVSDCRNIALRGGSVDAVVCFEVVEHVDEQERLLQEIRRVLRPEGVLVISTPNRVYYTEDRGERNPFHVREFDFAEFSRFLNTYFLRVELAFQNHVSSLFIGNPGKQASVSAMVEPSSEDLEMSSNFFVAVCSNSQTREYGPLVYLPSAGNLLREKDRYIYQLEKNVDGLDQKVLKQQREYDVLRQAMEERTQWAIELDRRVKELESRVVELQEEHRLQVEWAAELNSEITEKDKKIARMQSEFDERTAWALQLNDELKQSQQKLEKIRQSKLFQLSKSLGLVPKV